MGQVEVYISTDSWINKIKKLDPVMYEYVLSLLRTTYEIRQQWLNERDLREDEKRVSAYIEQKIFAKREILSIFRLNDTDAEGMDLCDIYYELQKGG